MSNLPKVIRDLHNRIAELEVICHKIQDDLLMRADIEDDGTRAVNVSSSIWNKFCKVLEQGECTHSKNT